MKITEENGSSKKITTKVMFQRIFGSCKEILLKIWGMLKKKKLEKILQQVKILCEI